MHVLLDSRQKVINTSMIQNWFTIHISACLQWNFYNLCCYACKVGDKYHLWDQIYAFHLTSALEITDCLKILLPLLVYHFYYTCFCLVCKLGNAKILQLKFMLFDIWKMTSFFNLDFIGFFNSCRQKKVYRRNSKYRSLCLENLWKLIIHNVCF